MAYMRFLCVMVMLGLGLAAYAEPDTLTFTDGRTITGTLVERRDGAIWFRHKVHGLETVKVYSEASVQSIELGSGVPVDQDGGDASENPSESLKEIPESEDQSGSTIDPLELESVRSQWRDLIPYATMNNPLYLVELNVITVAEAYARIHQYASYRFDAHPTLSSVGPGLMQYLADSETRVVPMLRSTATPMDAIEDPEGTLGSIFIELMSRQIENSVLHAWQNEYDERVRSVQTRLWPLTKELSGPIESELGSIEVTAGANGQPGLVIRNTLGIDLEDVAIKVVMETLDGRSSIHYFYLDAWESESAFYPRPAADWYRVGPKGTTHGTVELCASQLRLPLHRFEIPENIEWTVHHVVKPMIARSPTSAIRALAAAKQRSGNNIELNKIIYDLREYAKDHRASMIQQLEDRRPVLRKQIRDLRKSMNENPPGSPRFGKNLAEQLKASMRRMIEKKEAQLEAIERELRELRSPIPND